jgi:hypothetical protein
MSWSEEVVTKCEERVCDEWGTSKVAMKKIFLGFGSNKNG